MQKQQNTKVLLFIYPEQHTMFKAGMLHPMYEHHKQAGAQNSNIETPSLITQGYGLWLC